MVEQKPTRIFDKPVPGGHTKVRFPDGPNHVSWNGHSYQAGPDRTTVVPHDVARQLMAMGFTVVPGPSGDEIKAQAAKDAEAEKREAEEAAEKKRREAEEAFAKQVDELTSPVKAADMKEAKDKNEAKEMAAMENRVRAKIRELLKLADGQEAEPLTDEQKVQVRQAAEEEIKKEDAQE